MHQFDRQAEPQQSPASPQVQRVFLQPRQVGSAIDWDLGEEDPPRGGKKKIVVPKQAGNQEIHFHLLPGALPQAKFDEAEPIWVQEGLSCPPAQGSSSTEFSVISCSNRLLKIRDRNTKAATFVYQLNFIGAPPCDPIIENKGRP